MKILHLANVNSTNIGNGALIFGTEKVFKDKFKNEVVFEREAWDDYTFGLKKFDEKFIELVNNYDALLINGAVTMNAFRCNMKNTGMRFDLPIELWDKIKVPIVFFGISYRCWPFQKYPNYEQMKRTFDYMVNSESIYFGVRNDGTKEWIKKRFGIVSDKIIEIPDPGLFVPYSTGSYPELSKDKKNVIIAFNGEDSIYRYATLFQKIIWKTLSIFFSDRVLEKVFGYMNFHAKNRRKIIDKLARSIEDISRQFNCQFILCPHYLDDYGVINEFIDSLDERIAHQMTVSTGLLKTVNTEYFYGRYKLVDLAISMRVHSMSPCIGMGVPVIPLISQGRMSNFLIKSGLSDISVNIWDFDFDKLLTKKAIDILEDPRLLVSRQHKEFSVLKDRMYLIVDQVFNRIKKPKVI